ncbi:MAG: insulinase family protein [Lentimicrobiaceae bacterium]|nr:insulinase family protein [Lentimicrobiaceae bacterium]
MILFDRFVLDNGLKVLVHRDELSPIVAMNILYNVGSRDENPDRTGFAHLFEHLMFGGSVHIPRYDEPLERAGGENNAFTNNDITNYYLTIPRHNLETAFWLESDRMLNLAFTPQSLNVQRKVVIEEFRESYLNQPYGDAWLLLRPLAYKVHPYQWNTIGKDISHIRQAKMEEVKKFYHQYYNPGNAIMTIAGNVDTETIKQLCYRWFQPIENAGTYFRNLPSEPVQTEARFLTVERSVPFDSLYKAWHICKRSSPDFYIFDVISDLLANGDSSRLEQELVKKQQLFSEINAFVTGDFDEGLLVITGKLLKDIRMEQAEQALNNEISRLAEEKVSNYELQKVKNKIESMLVFSEMKVLDKAINLAFAELMGDANLVNTEIKRFMSVTPDDIVKTASLSLVPHNCSTLYYLAKQ